MTPPISAADNPATSAPDDNASPSVDPYHLQLSGGYTSLTLGNDAPTYSGSQFQASIGEAFPVSPRHGFFLHGVFRLASLRSEAESGEASMVHFGIEGGYEGWLVPSILGVSLFGGMGTNVFYSQQFGVAPSVTRSLNNQPALALTLGGGVSLVHGIFLFNGGIQPNFGLEVPPEASNGVPRGYNPIGRFAMAGFDLARLTSWAGGSQIPQDISFEQFASGIQPGSMLEATYTHNPANPADGKNALRVFDTRNDRPMLNYMKGWLDRPVDEKNPFGFRVDFGIGENSRVQQSRSSFSGDWYDLQQIYARLRLPIGDGLEVHSGKMAAPVGIDVIEGLLNNHISHSWQFGFAEPGNIAGVTATYPFVKDVFAATAGIYKGWDNVGLVDNTSGIGGLLNLSVNPTSFLSLSGTGTLGDEFGRRRSLIDLVATSKYNDAQSTAGNYDRFTLAAAYDRGHEGAGGGQPESNWNSFMVTGRVNFSPKIGYAQRFEVFADPQGARTGKPQTVWETTGTVHVTPLPWLRLRAEYRHDQASAQSFLLGYLPTNSQDTFGLGAGVLFQ